MKRDSAANAIVPYDDCKLDNEVLAKRNDEPCEPLSLLGKLFFAQGNKTEDGKRKHVESTISHRSAVIHVPLGNTANETNFVGASVYLCYSGLCLLLFGSCTLNENEFTPNNT